jgi:hypothetical protein
MQWYIWLVNITGPFFVAVFLWAFWHLRKIGEKNTKLPFFGHAVTAGQGKLSTGNCGCFYLFYRSNYP